MAAQSTTVGSTPLLFAVAAYGKFSNLTAYSGMITGMFKDTFLPGFLLTPYIAILPYAEALAALWVLVGFNLRAAWIFMALMLISLAFGMMVAKQNATDIFIYMLIACLGLYLSKYDGCGMGCGCKKA